ncbi:MAG: OmpA family protein [Micavibrio sp.]|jgi:outer membrane protein OmpA-like peptidoglycan-associated protein|nr:MAG: OmpA family protein [Micavibrio sp.]
MNKTMFLSAACVAICIGAATISTGTVQAQGSTLHYTPITEQNYRDNQQDWRVFTEYHRYREPCQHYVAPPDGYVIQNCNLYRVDRVAATSAVRTETTRVEQSAPAVPYYTILFDFDRSDIRPGERQKLAEAAREMQRYSLTNITIAGHTDSSGTAEYNQKLSERRADAVARELAGYGIKATIMDRHAHGERTQAVATADGVRMQENRRVIINFKR